MGRLKVTLVSLLLGVWTWMAQQSVREKPSQLPIGGHAGAVAIADLNGDGKPDIVAARIDNGTVSVFLGDGRGGFARVPGSPFMAGNNPEDLAVGDFDEDGHLDVVIANHETSYLTLLSGDGKGALAPASQSRVPISSRPHSHGLAARDFNGDRHLDLAVESRDENAVLTYLGDGQGRFAQDPKRFSVGRGPYWKLRSGDLNNDGKDDLVTTDNEGSSVSILYADRSGEFQPAKQIGVAQAPFAIAIGDVNADRSPDLAVVHRRGDSKPDLDALTVLLGRGNGVFVAAPQSPRNIGTSPTAIAIGDFDGDGTDDIAIASMGSNNVTVLLGSRSELGRASTSQYAVGQAPAAIALADLSGDGKADIVTGNWGSGDVSVVLGR